MSKAAVNTIFAVLLTASLAGIFFISWLEKDSRNELRCSSLKIEFTDSLKFIDEDNVRSYLDSQYGTYIGQRLDSIRLDEIEKIFEKRNSIIGSQAWVTDDGALHLSVSQRLPALRFMNGEKGFYIDNEGYIFPLHKTYVADVPVIEGKIPVNEKENFNGFPTKEEDKEWLLSMLEFTNMIHQKRNLGQMVENIYIEQGGDIALKMKNGEELFIFGDNSRMSEKLKLVDVYYKNLAGLKDYKTVNLKYKKQIICRTDI